MLKSNHIMIPHIQESKQKRLLHYYKKMYDQKSEVRSRKLISSAVTWVFAFKVRTFVFGLFNLRNWTISILLFFSIPALAQQVSLDSVLAVIQTNNPMVQEYEERAKAMEAYSQGATSWMAPMIGLGTFMSPYPGQTVMDNDKGMLMLSLEQDIPNPAKLRARKEFYESRAAIEEASQNVTYNQLRAKAKSQYYQWYVLEKQMEVLKKNKTIMETMKKIAEIRYPYQQGSLGNIYKAEARIHEIDNMILMTEAEIDEKNIMLNTLMNIPKTVRYNIDTTSVAISPLTVVPDTFNLAGKRSDIARIDRQINSMRLDSRLMGFDAKPDFRIRFDHMNPYTAMMPKQFTAMAMVSIPIAPWSSKMYKSQVKGMNFEIEAMKKEREAVLNEATGMVSSMLVEISRMDQQLANYKTKIIPALTRNYETVMLAYEENKAELPLVIDAWEALNMAEIEYLNKMQDYYIMIVNYEKELEK